MNPSAWVQPSKCVIASQLAALQPHLTRYPLHLASFSPFLRVDFPVRRATRAHLSMARLRIVMR